MFSGYSEVGWAALKALLLMVIAVTGLRLSERRLLAELAVFDLVVFVAIGAIVGRTATSASTPLATGAAALIALLIAHRVMSAVRRKKGVRGLLDRRPQILVEGGCILPVALRRAGLTEGDVYRLLREAGETDVAALRYVLYENTGRITVVRAEQVHDEAVTAGLRDAGVDADAG